MKKLFFREAIHDLFLASSSKNRSDSSLEYSIDTFWLCDNESAYDLWDIPILKVSPILKVKHEKYCLFWKKSKWSIFRANLLKVGTDVHQSFIIEWIQDSSYFRWGLFFYGLSTYNYLQCSSESGEIPIFYSIPKCFIFRSMFLKKGKRPQTNFDLQKFFVSCYQREDIRNVIKLPTFFVIGFERCSK